MKLDLTGKRFGKLLVIEKVDEPGKAKYIVRCDCGREKVVLGDNLKRGMTKSCGICVKSGPEWGQKRRKNIVGQRFGKLVVQEELGGGRVLCKCDCGNVKSVNKGHLLHGDITSCGCLLKSQAKDNQAPYYYDGTYIAMLRKREPNRDSKSGIRGVSWNKRKKRWSAQICIRGRRMHLGTYDNKEDAIRAREEAEKKYFAPAIEAWEKDQK